MTIVRPQKENQPLGFIIGLLSVSVFTAALFALVVYVDSVDIRHNIEATRESVDVLGLENVETKGSLLEMLDSGSLEVLARERGLVKENSPDYLRYNASQWELASHF